MGVCICKLNISLPRPELEFMHIWISRTSRRLIGPGAYRSPAKVYLYEMSQ